jgi:hypothetical protein
VLDDLYSGAEEGPEVLDPGIDTEQNDIGNPDMRQPGMPPMPVQGRRVHAADKLPLDEGPACFTQLPAGVPLAGRG